MVIETISLSVWTVMCQEANDTLPKRLDRQETVLSTVGLI